MKNIFVVSSTKSRFWYIKEFNNRIVSKKNIKLTTIFTGTHLIRDFGYTIKDTFKKENINSKKIKVTYTTDKNVDLIKVKIKFQIIFQNILIKPIQI